MISSRPRKKTALLSIAAITLSACALMAETLSTTNGKSYNNIKVISDTPEAVKISHEGGIATIPKKIIPPQFLSQHELSAPPVSVNADSPESLMEEALAKFVANVPTFTTKDGRQFPSSQITKLEPNGIKLQTANGIVKIGFSDLPERVRAALNYDPVKAAAYDDEQLAKQKEQEAFNLRMSNASSEVASFSANVRLNLIQNMGKGWLCSGEVLQDLDYNVTTSRAGSPLSGPKVIYETSKKTSTFVTGQISRMMVFGLPSYNSLPADVQARKQWSGKVYRVGTFSAQTMADPGGSAATLVAVHVDRNEAIRLIARNSNVASYNDLGEAKKGEVKASKGGSGSGTGFAISSDGYFGTAAHVVKDVSEVNVSINGSSKPARVVAVNDADDVAIIKVDGVTMKPLVLSKASSAKIGADLFCIGFPMIDLLGVNAKLTKGTLNALSGMDDDARMIQMSVEIQPGNSGGPVCTKDGHVIGVVSSRLRPIGSILPQNVNFAMKSDSLIQLASTVKELTLPETVASTSPEDEVMQSTCLLLVTVKDDAAH